MYKIKLTDAEMETLAWLTDRGYFPEETYDAMEVAYDVDRKEYRDTSEYPNHEWTWNIPEHAAWAISVHREEDPDSLYTCCSGSLLEKLLELEGSIV